MLVAQDKESGHKLNLMPAPNKIEYRYILMFSVLKIKFFLTKQQLFSYGNTEWFLFD